MPEVDRCSPATVVSNNSAPFVPQIVAPLLIDQISRYYRQQAYRRTD
jgi:hypothetical protein